MISKHTLCNCPAGVSAVPERHAPDCPGRIGAGKPAQSAPIEISAQDVPHFDDRAVDRFARAMKAKMTAARAKGRSGWFDRLRCPEKRLANMLVEHLGKGNEGTFEDVANFAMMLHQRGADPKVLAEAAEAPIKKARAEALELGVRALESKTELQPVATILLPDPLDEREGVSLSHADLRRLAALPAGTKLYAALPTGSPEGLLRSAQGGAE